MTDTMRAALAEVILKAMLGLAPGRSMSRAIADALLARGLRLPGKETMAWAVVGDDGRVNADTVCLRKDETEMICDAQARVVRVVIRVVEGGDDA